MKYPSKCKAFLSGLLLALTVAIPVAAQTIPAADDGTTLEQIIVFGRHSVRSPTAKLDTLLTYAVDHYPPFPVQPGYLTPHGQQAAALMGSYFRAYLLHERLLTGRAQTDLARSYFRANSIQRSNVTAAFFGAGLIPGATIPVHSFPLGQTDPVFDPLAAKVATVDPIRAAIEVRGLYNSGPALGSAYAEERSLLRSVLFGYPPGTQPPPATPAGKDDVASQPVLLEPSPIPMTGAVINLGGLETSVDAADAFVMEYATGLPMEQVAWGRLSLDAISRETRMEQMVFDVALRSPYLARVQSSNAASHILRTMEQAVIGDDIPGGFGNARSRVVVVISSDGYEAGLAGLLNLHWLLPGYQKDFCAPGGALVFELRRSRRSSDHIVRAFYTSQTFDQLRDLTPLTLQSPPATMQLLIPVEGQTPPDLDLPFGVFQKLLRKAIDPTCVDDPRTEPLPGVLTGVPLS